MSKSWSNLAYGGRRKINLETSVFAVEHGSHNLTEPGPIKEDIFLS